MHDVVVIGGGVIGLSIAYEAARRGLSVSVLDQGQPGREASWAGAGILPPGHPGSPLGELSAASTELWPRWSADLREETGIDNGYRRSGSLEFPAALGETLDTELAAWRAAGFTVETLSPAEIREREPDVSAELFAAVYRLPELAQVRNPWHLKALISACRSRGVEFRCGQPVTAFAEERGRVTSAVTPAGNLPAGRFVVASGAWSTRLLAGCCDSVKVEPIRGQIVLLQTHGSLFRHVLQQGPRYLVPRTDGRVLVGSTEERAGFEKANTAEAIAELMEFATSLVPKLAAARFERAWSGLRPRSLRGMPYLGQIPGRDNLFVATGHFRDGLKLSPATAVAVVDLLTGQSPSISLVPFAPA